MFNKTVKELMKPYPCLIHPEMTVDQAAKQMKAINCGVLPVGTYDNLIGILTDRDIVLRIVAEDLDADSTYVRDIMTPRVYACKEEETLQEAAGKMIKHQVSRMIVLDKHNHAVGILSYGSIIQNTPDTALTSNLLNHVNAASAA